MNEDTGFVVLKAKVTRHNDLVTVVGSLPSVSAGEWVTAQGRWVQDKEFGLQFKAEMLTSTAPTTKEGIEKYLGSGMVTPPPNAVVAHCCGAGVKELTPRRVHAKASI